MQQKLVFDAKALMKYTNNMLRSQLTSYYSLSKYF